MYSWQFAVEKTLDRSELRRDNIDLKLLWAQWCEVIMRNDRFSQQAAGMETWSGSDEETRPQ